ncbi:MAG: 6,7-dimethyl-8-ribityllumazine synthase [Cellvibrionaceae bacterium]|nr:6,7-dimethyl-8-ribityllumazine synthase [Cellvibrionaceae bacterium]
MAGYLPKAVSDFHKIPGARVAIIAALWHKDCIDAMIARAHTELLALDVAAADISVHLLPGSLELPYAARRLFETQPELDAIIAFGVVLKGATTHDDSVIQTVVDGFARVTDRCHKPIINEVIGVTCLEHAQQRADETVANKGVEAVFALSELLHWERSLQATPYTTGK